MNQINHRNIQVPEILDDDDVSQYISSFDSPKNAVRRAYICSAEAAGI